MWKRRRRREPEGTPQIQPPRGVLCWHGPIGRATYDIYRDGGSLEVYRDGRPRSSTSMSLEQVLENARRYEREVEAVTAALASGDPTATCRLGWHLRRYGQAWFRFCAGRSGKMLIFRVGAQPFDHVCTTIWCLGENARSWRCDLCGQYIPEYDRVRMVPGY